MNESDPRWQQFLDFARRECGGLARPGDGAPLGFAARTLARRRPQPSGLAALAFMRRLALAGAGLAVVALATENLGRRETREPHPFLPVPKLELPKLIVE